MILSDFLTYLRARKGGVFYSDVAEATGLSTLRIVRAERTLSVSDLTSEEIDRLAAYFDVPADELREARKNARGDLTVYLASKQKSGEPARLRLRPDLVVSGAIAWRDRHAVALRQPDHSAMVVYRSSVTAWGEESS